VYKAKRITTGQTYAVKAFKTSELYLEDQGVVPLILSFFAYFFKGGPLA